MKPFIIDDLIEELRIDFVLHRIENCVQPFRFSIAGRQPVSDPNLSNLRPSVVLVQAEHVVVLELDQFALRLS